MKIIINKKEIISEHLSKQVTYLENLFGKTLFNFKDFYFAGGCIYSIWNGQEPKDYDVFCKSKKAIRKLQKYFKSNPSLANIVTNNAITMGKFQFITKHIGAPETEISKFDFLHNCYWYDTDGLHR